MFLDHRRRRWKDKNVKYKEEEFEEVPGTLTLEITMARSQDDNKKKDKRAAYFRQTEL